MRILTFCTLITAITALLPIAAMAADSFEKCDVARRAYVIWETKSGPQLAAELSIGVYPKDALMSQLLKDNKQQNNDLAASPEQLIVKEFQLTLTADKPAILENYHGDEAKKYADSVYNDIKETQKWNKLVTDIKFQTKSIFGDTTRIRYVHQEKDPDAFAMPWSSLSKKNNDRYYFICTNADNTLFATVSELYPFWDASKNNLDRKLFSALKMAAFSPLESSTGQNDTNVVIYYNLNQFDQKEDLKKETLKLLEATLQAYENDDIPGILASWHPERRSRMKEKLSGDPYNFKLSKKYFSQAKSFSMDVYVGDSDDLFAFARRILKDGTMDTPKLFMFSRHSQKLFLIDKPASAPALDIINTPQMTREINKHITK